MTDTLSLFAPPPVDLEQPPPPLTAPTAADGFKLRDYQQKLSERIEAAWQQGQRRVMLQLPTGGGKTVLAGHLLHRNADWTNAWLTHRDVLRTQSAESLNRWGLRTNDMSRRTAGQRRWLPQTVNIVSTGLRTLPDLEFVHAGIMVIDEAHHAVAHTWASKLRNWPGRVLGVTATPWRLSPTDGFTDLFDTLICGPPVQQLVNNGALAEADVIYPPDFRIDRSRLRKNSMGDFDVSSAEAAQTRLLHLRDASDWHQSAVTEAGLNPETCRTLWFCASVPAARILADVLNEAGETAACVHADTPSAERARIISDLHDGRLSHVTNYEVFTEGLDVAAVDVAVLLRPTLSLTLHMQMIGRVLRPPGPVLILDAVGNTHEHGLHTEPREWSLLPRAEATETDGEPWTAECPWPTCGAMHPTATRWCKWCRTATGKECTGCRLWRRLTHYPTDPPTLDDEECGECQQRSQQRSVTAGRRHKNLRAELIDGLSEQPGSHGRWLLSRKGNPTVVTPGPKPDRYVVTRAGMVLKADKSSKSWIVIGPLTEPLIEKLGR